MFSKIFGRSCHVYHKIAFDRIHHRFVCDHNLRNLGVHIRRKIGVHILHRFVCGHNLRIADYHNHVRTLHSFGVRKKDSRKIVCSSFDRIEVGIHNLQEVKGDLEKEWENTTNE